MLFYLQITSTLWFDTQIPWLVTLSALLFTWLLAKAITICNIFTVVALAAIRKIKWQACAWSIKKHFARINYDDKLSAKFVNKCSNILVYISVVYVIFKRYPKEKTEKSRRKWRDFWAGVENMGFLYIEGKLNRSVSLWSVFHADSN